MWSAVMTLTMCGQIIVNKYWLGLGIICRWRVITVFKLLVSCNPLHLTVIVLNGTAKLFFTAHFIWTWKLYLHVDEQYSTYYVCLFIYFLGSSSTPAVSILFTKAMVTSIMVEGNKWLLVTSLELLSSWVYSKLMSFGRIHTFLIT